VVEREGAASIRANDVARLRLSLTSDRLDEDLAGRLVALAEGLAHASVALSVGPEPNIVNGIDDALLIPLGVAVALFVVSLIIANRVTTDISKTVPMVGFDFKTSFASTLTAVGAVLGTVVSAGVLPDKTTVLSKEAYASLNLLFGVAIVVAAVIPAAWQKGQGKETKVGLFWMAAIITLWAVFGELLTLWLLVEELGQDQGFTATASAFFRLLLVTAAVALLVYAPWRMAAVITTPSEDEIFEMAVPGTRRTPLL
jgi:hypothetical protein